MAEAEKSNSLPVVSATDPANETLSNWTTFRIAMWTMAMLFLSFPPVGIWPLAWVAPIPLIWLCGLRQLPGRRPYLTLWTTGLLYWLVTFYFIPIPHWALFFGWLTVSAYLAFYTVFFVGMTRSCVHLWRLPLWVAAPIVWTGIEWTRCVAFKGMGMVCLSHSQFKQPLLIQVSDLSGAYTLTFFMTLFASCLIGIPVFKNCCERKTGWGQVAVAIATLGFVIGYGTMRLGETTKTGPHELKIALVQGSIDTNLTDRASELEQKFKQYCELTNKARFDHPDLDLVVWPEGNFPVRDIIATENAPEWLADYDLAGEIRTGWELATGFPAPHKTPVPLLAGTIGTYEDSGVFNSAVLIRNGKIVDRYYKNHRVMFGEWFPILEWIPGFSNYFPSINEGKRAESMEAGNFLVAPSICFDTTVPHLIRRHVNQLSREMADPIALINVTNDGWFYGTSCLDFHLACNVFRAVENHKFHLVCANTGLSAEIDDHGRLLQTGPRRDTQVLIVNLSHESRPPSLYRTIGDWIPISFAAISWLALLYGWRHKRRLNRGG